jgi:acetyl esterase/lipase
MFQRLWISVLGCALVVAGLSAPGEGAPPTSKVEPDVVYGHKDGLALTFDVLYPPSEPNGAAVLFLVSGGWYSTWAPPEAMRGILSPYLDAGYTVFAIRHGSSPRYGIPDAVADVRRSVRFIRQHADRFGVDPARMAALGMSAGGHLALMLATTGDDGKGDAKDALEKTSSRVAAAVALVPPTDLRVMIWDAPESGPVYKKFPALNLDRGQAADCSPLLQVTPDDAPALVVMGGRDELVPARHGQWIQEAFEKQQVPSKLMVLAEAGHGLEGENRQRAIDATLAWLEDHLLEP